MTISNPIPEYKNVMLLPIVGETMLELGRKKTKIGDNWVTYKSWFEQEYGLKHVSIDIQGGYGSLPLDLTKPILMEPFDMVTNFGTTEHIINQRPVWENIHNLCKVDGVIVSMCPYPGDWWWHGHQYPTEEFYWQYAERNGYYIEYIGIGRQHPNRNIDVRMVKHSNFKKFVMPDLNTIYRNKIRRR